MIQKKKRKFFFSTTRELDQVRETHEAWIKRPARTRGKKRRVRNCTEARGLSSEKKGEHDNALAKKNYEGQIFF